MNDGMGNSVLHKIDNEKIFVKTMENHTAASVNSFPGEDRRHDVLLELLRGLWQRAESLHAADLVLLADVVVAAVVKVDLARHVSLRHVVTVWSTPISGNCQTQNPGR